MKKLKLYGYIFTWDGFPSEKESRSHADQFSSVITKHSAIRYTGEVDGLSSSRPWLEFAFHTPTLLDGEEPQEMYKNLIHRYPFYVRVNNISGTVIIASKRPKITDGVVNEINFRIKPNLRRKVVNIEEVSDHLLKVSPQEFAITYYMADVPGYGSALNTIALQGDNIAAADFLTIERRNFTARQIGIRPSDQFGECGRFGNTGFIQTRLENLRFLEQFLRYAYANKFYID